MGANFSLLEKGFINTEREKTKKNPELLDCNWMY